jgi:hypothetical protein
MHYVPAKVNASLFLDARRVDRRLGSSQHNLTTSQLFIISVYGRFIESEDSCDGPAGSRLEKSHNFGPQHGLTGIAL